MKKIIQVEVSDEFHRKAHRTQILNLRGNNKIELKEKWKKANQGFGKGFGDKGAIENGIIIDPADPLQPWKNVIIAFIESLIKETRNPIIIRFLRNKIKTMK